MKVRCFPVAEHYGFLAKTINERKGIKPGRWIYYLIWLVGIHLALVPLILLYFGQQIFAAVSIVLIMAFLIAYNRLGQTASYTEYYRQHFGHTPDEVEVEVLDEGVRMTCSHCSTLLMWKGGVDVVDADGAIYFIAKDSGIAVPKSAFANTEDESAFFEYARSRAGGG